MNAPILIVESRAELGAETATQLRADGYRVQLARTAEHARVLARSQPPRLALLGTVGHDEHRLSLLEEIRRACGPDTPWATSMPVIVLGSRSREPDIIRAFERGADDFLGPSTGYLELRARLAAVLRRTEARPGEGRRAAVRSLRIDAHTRLVSLAGRAVSLRRLEFDLLWRLASEPERVFATADLLRSVWGYDLTGSTRTVDTHASRLRRKLTQRSGERWVINVRRVGYRLI